MSTADADARWAALVAWARQMPAGKVQLTDKSAALRAYEVGPSGALRLRPGAPAGNCMQCVEAELSGRPSAVAVAMIIAVDGNSTALFHAAVLEAPAPCTQCSAGGYWRCGRCAVDVVVVTEAAGLRKVCPLGVYLRDNTVIEAARAAAPGSFAGFAQQAAALCAAWGKAPPY